MPVRYLWSRLYLAPCVTSLLLIAAPGCADPTASAPEMPVGIRVSGDNGQPSTRGTTPADSKRNAVQADEAKPTPLPRDSKPARIKPAMVHEAAAVLDVRSIPKLSEMRPMRESATTLEYFARGNVPSAAAFYRSELTRLGWKDLLASTDVADTVQYFESVWEKNGYFLKMTFGQDSEPNSVSVLINSLGNVDARKLPVVEGAESMNSGIPSAASHMCPSDVATVTAKSRELLEKQGWRPFQSFDPPLPANPQTASFEMCQGGIHLNVVINSHPQFQNGKTVLTYFIMGMLPFDMPATADARELKLNLLNGRFEYWTNSEVPALVEFYKTAYGEAGWNYPETKSAIGKDTAMLVFEHDRELRGLVQIRTREGGGMAVSFQRLAVIPASVEAALAAKEGVSSDFAKNESAVVTNEEPTPVEPTANTDSPDFPDVKALVNDILKDAPAEIKQSLKANSGVSLEVLESVLEKGEDVKESEPLVAEDKEGIPVPKNYTSYVAESSPFRRQMTATVPSTIDNVSAFYDRELSVLGWKATDKSSAKPEKAVELHYTKDGARLDVKLGMSDDGEVKIEILTRDSDSAKAAGLMPDSGKCRFMLGNGFDKDATIVIDGKSHTIKAGVGAQNPADAMSLHVAPGKYKLTVQIDGSSDESETLEVKADETWGVIVVPGGGYFAQQLY